jgi:peroxin-2
VWKLRVYKLCRWLETAWKALSLVNFIVFLCRGKYRTLIERVLRMRLVYIESRVLRQISFEFLNQQLLWQGMSEFMLFLMPLINFNWFIMVFRNVFVNPVAREIRGCGICNSEDITMPHVTPCGHLYCYYCISARVKVHEDADESGLDSEPYKCAMCSTEVYEYEPWEPHARD